MNPQYAETWAWAYTPQSYMIGDDAPVMPIVFYRHNHVGSDRIMDGVYSPNGLFTFETVWIDEDGGAEE